MARGRAIRRYTQAIIVLSIAYVALFFTAGLVLGGDAARAPLSYAIAILPALPIIGIFAAIGRYLVEEKDEYLRVLAVRQTLVATCLALSVATIWSFLESFGFAPHLDSYWVVVVWFLGLGVGALVNMLSARWK